MIKHSFFIAVYTNEVKSYCDKEFFMNLHHISNGNTVHVVDNSEDRHYIEKLKEICQGFTNFTFYYIDVERSPKNSLFHRRVTNSVMLLREIYLLTNLPYFFIIESDVIPPYSLFSEWDKRIEYLDQTDPDWGILGALYHDKFHLYFLDGLQQSYHALSGCTVYKRSLVLDYPFRWSEDDMNSFPDAWICWDAKNDYNIYNDHDVRCLHLENPKTGTRYTRPI